MTNERLKRNVRRLSVLTLSSVLAASALAPFSADAKPARQGIIMMDMPDGSTLPVQIKGDENAHRYFTEDGYMLTTDEKGLCYYATLDAKGNIVSTGRRAVAADKRTAADRALLSKINTQALLVRAENIDTERRENLMNRTSEGFNQKPPMQREINSQGINLLFSDFPSKGTPKGLVVLVEYQDVKFETADPFDYFNRMLNQDGFSDFGSIGSARDFFKLNSNGQFIPDFDVYGPVTLPNNRSYYGGSNDANAHMMAVHALNILDATVDFSQYCQEGTSFIDNVYIFYAGKGEADGGGTNTVWPHSFFITSAEATPYIYDGVQLDRYACSNEIDNTYRRADGIGTFVHEFSHVMGLPDLYSTNYSSSFTPGQWSALDYGPYNNKGLTPPNYSIFERYALGWMEPKRFSGTGTANFTLQPITTNNGYLVPNAYNKNEFILVEVRKKEGFDKYIPNSGMLIWRIDYDKNAWMGNSVNNIASRQRVDIIEADNTKTDRTRAGDCFPGTANVTSFTRNTLPAFTTRVGRTMNVEFENIVRNQDGTVSFDAITELEGELGAVNEIAAANGLDVTVTGRMITVNGETQARVFNIAGTEVGRVNAGSSLELPTAGIYLVVTPDATRKVIIK